MPSDSASPACSCPPSDPHPPWCAQNADRNLRRGPGSDEDARKAIVTLEALMVAYYPRATGYSHAMVLIARDLIAHHNARPVSLSARGERASSSPV